MTDQAGRGQAGGGRRVLVVDDDDLLREVAQAALGLVGGWQVEAARSGAEARERAVARRPDAILMDVMMPGVDGPSAAAALRADPATRDVPIIFLTAKAGESADQWQHLRLAGVIAKPFDPMTLADQMSRLLGW